MITKLEGYPDTPNLDKMLEVQSESEILTRFVEWLNQEKGYYICEWYYFDGHRVSCAPIERGSYLEYANYGSYDRLFADFFGIDYGEIENERLAVLQFVRDTSKEGEA